MPTTQQTLVTYGEGGFDDNAPNKNIAAVSLFTYSDDGELVSEENIAVATYLAG